MNLLRRVVLLCAVLAVSAAAQRQLVVPTQYATIQAAIDAAQSNDTVLVLPGTYRESITIQGKAIRLIGRDGPTNTVIDATGSLGRVVTLLATATIEGFTIRGGSGAPGGGIGIATSGRPTIAGNIITNNSASSGLFRGTASGGGIGGVFPGQAPDAIVINNVIARNTVSATVNGYPGIGAGAILGPHSVVANNTFVLNSAIGSSAAPGIGGGLFSLAGLTVTNCVFWLNTATQAPHISGATAQSSLLGVDPKLMDAQRGDYHLRYDSPARDQGVSGPGIPTTDWEGDSRVVDAAPDIGADEFSPRLYATGQAKPGGLVHVKIVGPPSTTAWWAYSLNPALRNPPVTIPGLGLYYLNDPMLLNPAGSIPPVGVTIVPVPIPTGLPVPIDVPIQALIGSRLSNPWVVRIR